MVPSGFGTEKFTDAIVSSDGNSLPPRSLRVAGVTRRPVCNGISQVKYPSEMKDIVMKNHFIWDRVHQNKKKKKKKEKKRKRKKDPSCGFFSAIDSVVTDYPSGNSTTIQHED